MSADPDDFWANFVTYLRDMDPLRERIYYGELKLARVWPAHDEPDPERRELLVKWAREANERTARGVEALAQ